MGNNLNKVLSVYKIINYNNNTQLLSEEYHNNFIKRENSLIIEIFYKQLNIYKCNYGNKSFSFDKIFDIPLLIPENVLYCEFNSLLIIILMIIKILYGL